MALQSFPPTVVTRDGKPFAGEASFWTHSDGEDYLYENDYSRSETFFSPGRPLYDGETMEHIKCIDLPAFISYKFENGKCINA